MGIEIKSKSIQCVPKRKAAEPTAGNPPAPEIPAFKIDLQLLRKQKRKLVEWRAEFPPGSPRFELLSGVIHLCDGIQDILEN